MNERWLDQFRPWVYGAGFGWQIGTGLATYIVTAAVYLMVVLAALVGNGWAAVGLGALFGLVRGLSVYLGRHITSADALRNFHQWFSELGPKVRRATIAVEGAVVVLFAWILAPWAAVGIWPARSSGPQSMFVSGPGGGWGRRWVCGTRRSSGWPRRAASGSDQGVSDGHTMAEMALTVSMP